MGLTAAGNIVEVLPILLNNLSHDDAQGNYLTLIAIRQGTPSIVPLEGKIPYFYF